MVGTSTTRQIFRDMMDQRGNQGERRKEMTRKNLNEDR